MGQNVRGWAMPAAVGVCCCFSWPLKRDSTKVGLDHRLPQDHREILKEPHLSHRETKPPPKGSPGSDNVTSAETTRMVGARREDVPWRMNVWLVSSKISQPSTIILSMARFFLMFSVSLTSSCIILSDRTQTGSQRAPPGSLYQCKWGCEGGSLDVPASTSHDPKQGQCAP